MYNALFTEFSYGYALTDNIIHAGLPSTSAAPVFPSLIAEGSAGGGYDVQIPAAPVPVFLQFKIPQVVRRKSAKMPAGFSKPYLRMHLRTKRPNQHRLLLNLEVNGSLVAYATPDFWTTNDLDSHYVNQRVHLRSRYFLPSDIGRLRGDGHYVAYCPRVSSAYVYSEPELLSGESTAESFGKRVSAAVNNAPEQEPLDFFNKLKSYLLEITKHDPLPPTDTHGYGETKSELVRVARDIAYVAQVRLGCTFIVAGRPTRQSR